MSTELKTSVANGEIGEVIGFLNGKVLVRIPSQNLVVEVPYFRLKHAQVKPTESESDADGKEESDTGCDMDIGFSCSSHKSQGAQFDYVIVALDEYPGAVGSRGICKREWLFTAISRAKIACFLVGLRSTALAMIAETSLDKRKTFLAELIVKYRKENEHLPALESTCETLSIESWEQELESESELRSPPPRTVKVPLKSLPRKFVSVAEGFRMMNQRSQRN